MENVFVKKNWEEENVLFYLHFQNGETVRQIEIKGDFKLLLSTTNPQNGDSFMYDQSLEELDLQESDFISEKEFNLIWEN